MKSPFPGMDPYLEDQGRWPDFHASVITYCRDALSDCLPDDYVAQMGEEVRVVTWQEGHDRLDETRRGDRPWFGSSGSEPAGRGMVATLEPIAIPFAAAVDEVRDTWIEIRRLPDERLVTAIEVLSPTNKGSSGLSDYLEKRHRSANSGGQPGRDRSSDRGAQAAHGQTPPARRLLHHRLPGEQERYRRRLRLVDPAALAEGSDPPGRPRSRRLSRPGRGLRPGLPARPLCPPDPLRQTARPPTPPTGQGVGREDRARLSALTDASQAEPAVDLARIACSLDRAVIGRIEEDRLDLVDQHAVAVAFLVDLLPFGVVAERLPGRGGGLAAGERDQVDQLRSLAVLLVLRCPEADQLGAVFLEQAGRYDRETACADRSAFRRWCNTSGARRRAGPCRPRGREMPVRQGSARR